VLRRDAHEGLPWLESKPKVFPEEPSYAGFHLVSMWGHLALYDVVPLGYPRLDERVARLSTLGYVAKSAPSL
jgi:hypothetical protein